MIKCKAVRQVLAVPDYVDALSLALKMQFNMLLTLLLSIISLAAASPAFGLVASTIKSIATDTLASTSGSLPTVPVQLVDCQTDAFDACKDWCIHGVCGDYHGTDMYGQCIDPCIDSNCLWELPTETFASPARRQIDSCDDLCHYYCKNKPYDECEGPCVEQNCGFTQFTDVAQRVVATEAASVVPTPGFKDRISTTPLDFTPTTASQGLGPTGDVIGRRDLLADCSIHCKYICGNSPECIPSCIADCESRAPPNKVVVDASSNVASIVRRGDVSAACSVHCKYVCGNSPECLPSCIANCEPAQPNKATDDASLDITGAISGGDVSTGCSIHCRYICGNSPECMPSCIANCESAPPSKVTAVHRQDYALVQCEKQCLDETCGESIPDCMDTCVPQCMAEYENGRFNCEEEDCDPVLQMRILNLALLSFGFIASVTAGRARDDLGSDCYEPGFSIEASCRMDDIFRDMTLCKRQCAAMFQDKVTCLAYCDSEELDPTIDPPAGSTGRCYCHLCCLIT
ncbi:hypothetical protein UCRNP2_6792 [Neofusicoccum parvum UCRNP2]|uniref:Uncharacterized protein n=1 Tax=Botryosphaeria parva (strain UCR-NP2) TaxID=1287680 RepID=R1EFD0_BOTPV|nr:hypothetical protein UCRNP2_6792 [Neofusicoccum parvum UCRNP2]